MGDMPAISEEALLDVLRERHSSISINRDICKIMKHSAYFEQDVAYGYRRIPMTDI